MRRLITLGIWLVGLLFALSQFGGLNKLAVGLLASGAIVAGIVGFAARQTLANLVGATIWVITWVFPLTFVTAMTWGARRTHGSSDDVR